jgi:tetratricopeptide (TPR) repeat protein
MQYISTFTFFYHHLEPALFERAFMKMKSIYSFVLILVSAAALLNPLPNVHAAHDFDVYIAQGIQMINDAKYSEALEVLEKALEASPEDPEAAYYSAIALSRLGDLGKAEELLLKIEKEGEYASNIFFELGRIYYAREECRRADDLLTKFIALSDDEDEREYAKSLIDDCYGASDEEKLYRLNLTVGSQYDSNVVLEATNPSVSADKKRDGKVVALIEAGARVYSNRAVRLNIDYNLYQSLHFELNNFNVNYHKITPSVELNISDRVTPSAGYSFEYIYFGGDDYGRIGNYFAKVNIEESRNCSTELLYKYRDIKYWNTEEFLSNSERTGDQDVFGVKQKFIMDRFRGDIHYFYNDKSADASHWSYRAYRVGLAATYKMDSHWKIKVLADYQRRKYDDVFPSFGEVRLDKMQKYAINVQYALTEKMAVTLKESYTYNDSNLRDYDYSRNLIGLLLTYGVF